MLGRRWEGRAAPSAIPDLKGRASPPRGHLPSPRGLTLGPVPGAGVPREPPLGSVPARRLHLWSLTARRAPSPGWDKPHPAPLTPGPAAAATVSPSNASPRVRPRGGSGSGAHEKMAAADEEAETTDW